MILIGTWIMLGSCEKSLGLESGADRPSAVFDEAWKVIDQRYALFSEKELLWSDVRDQYRARISDDMSTAELFDVISDMLETLKDGHVSLVSQGRAASYQGFYELFPVNFDQDIVLSGYLQGQYEQLGPVIYKIQDGIGYVAYNSFSNDITDSDCDMLFTLLSATRGIILDVRDNLGGNSANVERLLSHFISEEAIIKYEQFKTGKGHADLGQPQFRSVLPRAPYVTVPVALLTNRKCFSACNDLVMYLSRLQRVRVFGDNTGGGGSIPYEYLLPNGWSLHYSGSMTLDPDLQPIDGGIVPDQAITITPVDQSEGRDPILQAAFDFLR